MLRLTACLITITIIDLTVSTDEVLAQRLSRKQCQRAHERIAQRYSQSQPSPLNSSAYQRWTNSLMNTIREFEEEHPECPSVTGDGRGNSLSEEAAETGNRIRRNLDETERNMNRSQQRQLCRFYGFRYDARTNDCY